MKHEKAQHNPHHQHAPKTGAKELEDNALKKEATHRGVIVVRPNNVKLSFRP